MVESAQIILASASPRRRELLEQIGITVMVQAVDIDESRNQDEPVIDFVERLAMEKAQRGFDTMKNVKRCRYLAQIPSLRSEVLFWVSQETASMQKIC